MLYPQNKRGVQISITLPLHNGHLSTLLHSSIPKVSVVEQFHCISLTVIYNLYSAREIKGNKLTILNISLYHQVDLTFGLPDYVCYIEECVISRFYSIHFTVTLAGTQNVVCYIECQQSCRLWVLCINVVYSKELGLQMKK